MQNSNVCEAKKKLMKTDQLLFKKSKQKRFELKQVPRTESLVHPEQGIEPVPRNGSP